MISSLTALLIVLVAVIGSGAMVGVLAYFLQRLRQIESKATDGGVPNELAERLAYTQEELLAVQDQLAALSERLDFTEKLLARGEDQSTSGRSE